MIWFSCKKCGKKHSRPEGQAGTMIFCDCGQGLLVPWSSTIAEPARSGEPLDAIPVPERAVPPARAVPVDEPKDRPRRPSVPLPPSPPSALPKRRHRQFRKVNADYCLNHEETAQAHHCADCRLPFCDACLVPFRGQMLCGPCKNFRLRALNRPPRMSVLAVVGMVAGLVGGPAAFCLGSMTMTPELNPQGSVGVAMLLTFLGMLFPGGAMALSAVALRYVETRANVGGRGLALTGLFLGLVGVLWNLTVGILILIQQASS